MNDLTSEIGLIKRQMRDVQSVTSNVQHLVRRMVDGRASSLDRPGGGLTARMALCSVLAFLQNCEPDQIARQHFNNDRDLDRLLTLRAVASPANSTIATWAAELVATATEDISDRLIPEAVFSRLREQGIQYSLAGALVRVPSWSPTASGNFVIESGPIPVASFVLGEITLKPKKAAVISAFNDELLFGSPNDVELALQTILGETIGLMIDSVLLGSAAATAAAPAGLLAGVSPLTASAGGGLTAMLGDMKLLTAAIAPALRPTLITGPLQGASLRLLAPNSGLTVLISPTLAAGTVIAVDASAFVSGMGIPSFRASQSVTAHMDSAATALSATATPNVVAAPMRSMFQTDTTALRSIIPIDWALRRTGAVATINSATW